MKTLLASITALALVGGAASAQISDWDANEDAMLDRDEFRTGIGAESDRWNEIDADQSGEVDEEEFQAGMGAEAEGWGESDADQSGGLSQEEFGDAQFDQYDQDQDDMLNEEERAQFEEDWNTQVRWSGPALRRRR